MIWKKLKIHHHIMYFNMMMYMMEDCLRVIGHYLNHVDLCAVMRTCVMCYKLAKHDNLWTSLLIEHFATRYHLYPQVETKCAYDKFKLYYILKSLCYNHSIRNSEGSFFDVPADIYFEKKLYCHGILPYVGSSLIKLFGSSLINLIELMLSVESYQLSFEQLSSIPNLQSLTLLRCCKLTTLSSSVGVLTNLQKLDVSGNKIMSLPKEVGLLINLRHLSLSRNKLKMLPSDIGCLTKLQKLYVDDNMISSLPFEIWNLKLLEHLDLNNNYISSFPINKFGPLEYLSVIHVEKNELTSLEFLTHMHNIIELSADDNIITCIPSEISCLTKLKQMYVRNNVISTVHQNITTLTNLQTLNMTNNCISELPYNIGSLINLTHLNLEHNWLSKLPSSCGSLINLKYLHLGNNYITYLTDISNLKKLKFLTLDNNKLSNIPNLESDELTILRINNNMLKYIPSTRRLVNLESFDCHNNMLNMLPEDILLLHNLKRVTVYDNKLDDDNVTKKLQKRGIIEDPMDTVD